ncbi:MAG TPA: hypothetical protein VF892_05620 [Pseudonocardiaceae bacterium]
MTDSLTIIISPGSTMLREHIAAWTAARLLRPSVWIDPTALAEPGPDLVDITVSQLGEKRVDTTLRSVLGDTEPRLVRVLLVRGPVDDDVDTDPVVDPYDPEVADRTWQFAGRLRAVLAAPTRLRRLNVIVPNGPEVDPRLLDVRCDVNVVVSPEDRPTDGAVDHGVSRPDIYPAHAAFAAATIGALWTDMAAGAFDQPADEDAEQHGRTVVVRATARVVNVDSLPTKIIGKLLASGTRSLREYVPPSANRTANSAGLVKDVFEAFVPVERKVLWYRPPTPPPDSERPRIVAMTFGMLLRFLLQVLRLRLMEWRAESRTRLEEAVEKWLFRVTAPESGDLPEYGPPTADEMSAAATQAPINSRTSALMPGVSPVTPFLWPLVRRLCFSLIDGGKPPADVAKKFNTLRPTLTDPSAIVAEPEQRFVLSDVELTLLRHSKLGLSRLRVMDNSTVDRLDRVLSEALAAERPPGVGKAMTAAQAWRVLGDCQTRLRAWRDSVDQDSSLMGRLLKHVRDQMTLAKDALIGQADEYRREEQERMRVVQRLEMIRAQLTKFMLSLLAPLLLGVVALGFWLFSTPGVLDRAAGITAICCAVGVGVVLLVLSIMAERAGMLDRELDRIEARREHTVALVVQWPSEAARLSSLYSVLLDWAEIIGWLLHQPFRRETDLGLEPESVDLPRPETFHLVQPADELDDLVREVAPTVFTEGWLERLYELVVDSAISERTRPDHQADPRTDPDLAPGPVIRTLEEEKPESTAEDDEPDDIEPIWHARDRLLRRLRRDHEDATVARYLRSAVWQALCELPPAELTSLITVNPVDGNGVTHELTALDFMRRGLPPRSPDGVAATLAPAAFSDTGMMLGRPQVGKVHLWGITGPLGVTESDQDGAPGERTITAWPLPATDTTNAVYQVALIRLDVSSDCDMEDLAIVPSGTETPDPIAD